MKRSSVRRAVRGVRCDRAKSVSRMRNEKESTSLHKPSRCPESDAKNPNLRPGKSTGYSFGARADGITGQPSRAEVV